jgi:hypothetical protein
MANIFPHGTVHKAAKDLQAALRSDSKVFALWETEGEFPLIWPRRHATDQASNHRSIARGREAFEQREVKVPRIRKAA